MPHCSVVNCHVGNHSFPTPADNRWFTFPKDKYKRNIWVSRIHTRKNFNPNDKTSICSIHFREEDFLTESENKGGKISKAKPVVS